MKKTLLRALADQRGVAMVTVLFIGATLTAVASAAAFATVKELRSSTEDRRSAQALAFAEAGVDRMINYLRSGRLNWQNIALAGCPAAGRYSGEANHPSITLPTGTEARLGDGSFTVRFEIYNPITSDPTKRFAPGACTDASYERYFRSPKLPPGFWSGDAQYFAIVATGASATSASPCPQLAGGACRTVRQVVRVRGIGLPVGIYAEKSIDLNGTPTMNSLSMITPGSVLGREKVGFSGYDKYYHLADFGWGSMAGATTTFIPAAVHAGGSIALKNVAAANTFEHPNAVIVGGSDVHLNCTANDLRGTAGQSQWDQSGPSYGGDITSGTCPSWLGTPSGPPPRSAIDSFSAVAPQPDLSPQDYEALKATAQSEGLYCRINANNSYVCRRMGGDWPAFNPISGVVQDADLTGGAACCAPPSVPRTFVAYFDYETEKLTNTIKWRAGWGPCTDDPNTSKQVVLIVRNGNLQMSSNDAIHGAVIVPEGLVEETGTATIEGTIIAETFSNRGTGQYVMTDCALRNLPIPWLDMTPSNWIEVDR